AERGLAAGLAAGVAPIFMAKYRPFGGMVASITRRAVNPPAAFGTLGRFFPDEPLVQIVALDLEGVLVPEIWIAFSERTGIPKLRRTTRDEPDYDKLMRFRLDLLRRHNLGLPDIQKVIRELGPMPGAKE